MGGDVTWESVGWPTHADGSPVMIGEKVMGPHGQFTVCGVSVWSDHAALMDMLGRVAMRVRTGDIVQKGSVDDDGE